MDKKGQKSRSGEGFTLLELLLTVFIIICLLAVSAVAIVKYMRHLQITDLDNAAREIYMAAQNRAVLLKNGETLDQYVIGDGSKENKMEHVDVSADSDDTTQITAYYIHCKDAEIKELVPEETIESSLWEGDFYIVYEPTSGSVTDVFFGRKTLPLEGGFDGFYRRWRAKPRSERMKSKPMIGYYGGEAAESGDSISLRTPVINIYNEEELRAEITYWVPRSLALTMKGEVVLKVELDYPGFDRVVLLDTATLGGSGMAADRIKPSTSSDMNYHSYTYTLLLDSVESKKQFQDLFPKNPGDGAKDGKFGGNFTLSAEVSYVPGTGDVRQVNGARKSAEDNSLFAKDSTQDTAHIGYMRHLQNLNAAFSGVAPEKTGAEQIADITCIKDYLFIPVENEALTTYDGKDFEIRELCVSQEENKDERNEAKAAGLFGEFGSSGQEKTLQNIALVNAKVKGGSQKAGALVGDGTGLRVENCRVYWESQNSSDTNLQELLGNTESGLDYVISSETAAGGLAGSLTESEVKKSFAAVLVKGSEENSYAGGLIGSSADSLIVEHCYADSYLQGANCGGLVGNMGGSLKMTDSYVAGFIDSDAGDGGIGGTGDGSGTAGNDGNNANDDKNIANGKAAGICLGNGTSEITNSYSVMLFTLGASNYPLCENQGTIGEEARVHFLNYDEKEEGGIGGAVFGEETVFEAVKNCARGYADLSAGDNLTTLFGSDAFEMKTAADSHPYNLNSELALKTYVYPGLKELEHYNDWGAKFGSGGLVYYEKYEDGAYGFSGANMDLLQEKQPVEDGYAVVLRSTDVPDEGEVTLKISYRNDDGQEMPLEVTYAQDKIQRVPGKDSMTGKEMTYCLMALPAEVVNTKYAAPDFYQEISFEVIGKEGGLGNGIQGHYYYSPHFAETALEYDERLELGALANGLTVKVRTPRHLYNLSEHKEYYG